MVEFWSHGLNPIPLITYIALILIYIDYIYPRAYNHFITSTLCKKLTSADLSLIDQTLFFVSEAIKYGDSSFTLFGVFKLIYR